jgi:hypothetical protein
MDIDKNYLRNFLHDDIINMGFDEDSIDMAIDAFIESVEEAMPPLQDSIDSSDMENIRFYAHALKGTFANFENSLFKDISDKFKDIEFAAKENRDIDYIKERFNDVLNNSSNWLKI